MGEEQVDNGYGGVVREQAVDSKRIIGGGVCKRKGISLPTAVPPLLLFSSIRWLRLFI